MATPEETRDRIKAMRDRIFNDSDKGSTENNVQEKELAERNPKILETSEASTGNAKPAKTNERSSSEKLQQDDDSISFLSSETQKKISEIIPNLTSKIGILETTMLEKLENAFNESNSKITEIEQRVNNSILSSTQANESLKEELQKLSRSLQLDITSIAKRLSSSNQKIDTEFQNNSEKLSKFENSVEERQNALENSFYEKLQQNDDKISLSNADTQKQLSEITINMQTEFQNNSEKLSELENSVEERQNALENSFYEKLQQNDDKISLSNADTQKQLSEITINMQTELQNNVEKLSKFENSVEERHNALENGFYEKLQQNGDKISLLNEDTQRQISEIAHEFTNKSSSLETDMLEKLEHAFAESNSKISGIEQLVNNSVISSSQENKALKERLDELNRSLEMDISSVAKRLSSANEKIETKLQNNSEKLSKFENSVEERYNALENGFYEKLQQNGDKISLLSEDTQRQISEIAREFANKSSSLETDMLDKLENISFHLRKVEEQIENQIGDLSTSLQKYVLSITDSQEDKIDAQAKKIEKNVSSLKQEIFEYKRELKADIDKKIKESELKTNDYLSQKIFEVRDLLLGEFKSLSEELSVLKNVFKEKHSELNKHIKNNVSTIKKAAEKDRKYFNNRFETVSESIQSVEAMIVKEDDLIDLFQNYTLNVNISDKPRPSKR